MRRTVLNILLLFPLLAYADHFIEFGLHGGGALWNAKTNYVQKQVGLHAGGQIYYSLLSSELFGFRTGLTIDYHNPAFAKLNYEDAYSTTDVENQQMDISYSIGRLREYHTMWSVGIPLQLALSVKQFTLFIGPKAVFPLKSTWTQTIENASLSIYYPDYDNHVEESDVLAASRSFMQISKEQWKMPKVQFWLSAELNYAIPINTLTTQSYNTTSTRLHSYIMVGAYFDYCVSRLSSEASDTESLIMLTDTREGLPLQRLYSSVWEGNRQQQQLVKSGTLFDVGIKISYALSPFNPAKSSKHSCHCL